LGGRASAERYGLSTRRSRWPWAAQKLTDEVFAAWKGDELGALTLENIGVMQTATN
jgi:hypothetical protein